MWHSFSTNPKEFTKKTLLILEILEIDLPPSALLVWEVWENYEKMRIRWNKRFWIVLSSHMIGLYTPTESWMSCEHMADVSETYANPSGIRSRAPDPQIEARYLQIQSWFTWKTNNILISLSWCEKTLRNVYKKHMWPQAASHIPLSIFQWPVVAMRKLWESYEKAIRNRSKRE